MNVTTYSLFRAGCRFWLGSRVPAWGAWVPWCRAGWACSWCAARRGGCGIIRVDRAPGVDPVPPGGPDPPGRPFPPSYLRAPGREGHQGRRGEQEPGRTGVPGGRPVAAACRPRPGGGHEATRGLIGSVVPGGPDLPPFTRPTPWPRLPGLVCHHPRWPRRLAVPAARGHTVTVASITRRRAELAGWLRGTPLPSAPAIVHDLYDKPRWQVPATCPECGARMDQSTESMVDHPACLYCAKPLPCEPVR